MNKLELIKKDLEEGADYNFDNWNKGDLQMLEEIVIATENVVKKLTIPVVSNRYSDEELKEFTVEMVKQITGKDVTNECVLQGNADAQICFYYLKEVNNGC